MRQVAERSDGGASGEELSRLAELKDPWPHLGAEFERLNPRHLARRVPPGVTLSWRTPNACAATDRSHQVRATALRGALTGSTATPVVARPFAVVGPVVGPACLRPRRALASVPVTADEARHADDDDHDR
jgi:hypothetical protein